MTEATQTDGGWSWVVLFSTFIATGVLFGMGKCSGVLYTMLSQHYGISRSAAATTSTLYTSLMLSTGILSGALCKYFTHRQVSMLGGILATSGLIVCSFAPTAVIFTVGYGFILALGGGLTLVPAKLILTDYFSNKLSLALGLSIAGSCLGGIIFPPLLVKLESIYGFSGAILILSGLILHIIPAGATFFPRKKKIKESSKNLDTGNCTTTVSAQVNGTQMPIKTEIPKKNRCKCPIDLSVLINYHFILITISSCCGVTGYSTMSLSLPDYAVNELSEPITRPQAALILSSISVGDFIGRILIAFLSHRLTLKYSYMVGVIISASSIFLVPFIDGYWTLISCASLYGIAAGTVNVTNTLLINEYIPPAKWGAGYGFSAMFNSFPILTVAPIIGYIRDSTGSYVSCFKFISIVNMIGVLPWILETILNRKRNQLTYWINSKDQTDTFKRSEALRASLSM